jgi:hypothetical protein
MYNVLFLLLSKPFAQTPIAGNERFRIIIETCAPLYHQAKTKYQKSEVIANIVADVRKYSPGGGFVKKDFYSGRWFEIGDEKARDKVGKLKGSYPIILETIVFVCRSRNVNSVN